MGETSARIDRVFQRHVVSNVPRLWPRVIRLNVRIWADDTPGSENAGNYSRLLNECGQLTVRHEVCSQRFTCIRLRWYWVFRAADTDQRV